MGSATKEKQKEAEAKRDQDRRAQGLPEGSVPEQRPVASQQIDPASESAARQQEIEDGALEPMPQSAYDKAASASQLKKAEKEERELGPEHFREGDKVTIRKDGDPYDGAVGVIDSLEWASPEDRVAAKSGDPAVERFAAASSYIVKTRAQGQRIECEPDEVEAFDRQLGVDVTEK